MPSCEVLDSRTAWNSPLTKAASRTLLVPRTGGLLATVRDQQYPRAERAVPSCEETNELLLVPRTGGLLATVRD